MTGQHCCFDKLLFPSERSGLVLACCRDSSLKQTSRTQAAINSNITEERISACNYIFLLTTSGRGIPARALSCLDLFPPPCAPLQPVPSLNLPRTCPWAHWTCLPAPAAISTKRCLSCWYPEVPRFSGSQEGKGKNSGMNPKKTKGLCMVFTLVLRGSRSHPPAAPKQATQKEAAVSASQMSRGSVVLQNNKEYDLCHFLIYI